MSWPTKKLGELIHKHESGVWGNAVKDIDNGFPILRSVNFTNEGKIDWSDLAYREVSRGNVVGLQLKEGEILLEKSGGSRDQPVGRVLYFQKPPVKLPILFGNFIEKLVVNEKLIIPRFLYYYLYLLHLTGFTRRLQMQTTGIRNLQLKRYLNLEIPHPSLKVQQKIVERLDAIKRAQELNEKQISLADELFQSLLYKELKPKKNWEIKKLGEVAEIIMGQSPPSSSYNDKGKGLPFFQGKAEFGEIYPIPVKHCSSPSRIAEANDILMSVRAPVGNINLAKERSCIGRGLAALRAKENILDQMFLYYLMKKNENNWSRLSVGSTFSAIRRNNLENLDIPLPQMKAQKQIVEKLSAVQDYKKKLLEQKELLQELFESTLNKAMKGEL